MLETENPVAELQKTLRFLRIGILCAAIVLLGWLVFLYVRPTGVMNVRYRITPEEKSSLIKGFASKEKARIIGQKDNRSSFFQEITVDPVYFSVPTIRNWESATVSIVYENPNDQPIIRLGTQTGSNAYSYRILAAHDARLDTLRPYWQEVREGETVLWQKNQEAFEAFVQRKEELDRINERYDALITGDGSVDITTESDQETTDDGRINVEKELAAFDYSPYQGPPTFQTIADFLGRSPDPEKIITFNYTDELLSILPGYTPAAKRTTIEKSLRGSHTIVAYVGDEEDLDFHFVFRDLNRHKDNDHTIIVVSRGSKELLRLDVPDDGIHGISNDILPEREQTVKLSQPGRGVYKIRLVTTDDTFITRFDTLQHRFFFEGKIYLTENEEYRDVLEKKIFAPTTLYTQGSRIVVRTSHDAGKQTFRVGDLQRTLKAPQQQVAVEDLIGKTQLLFPKNDVFLEGGSFAFSKSAFFADELKRSSQLEDTNLPIDAFDYIIAQETGVTVQSGLYTAQSTTVVPQLKKTDGAYHFIINVPGLSENKRRLRIYEMSVTFRGAPLTPKNVLSKAKKFFNTIF